MNESWQVAALAIQPTLKAEEIREHFAVFKDHWLAKAGRDGTKVDWLATWRNWIRRQKDYAKPNKQTKKGKSAWEIIAEQEEASQKTSLERSNG